MKYLKHSLLALMLGVLSFLWSCDPFGGDPKYIPKIYLEDKLLDYTYFPEGSYWIYQNTVTGALDSSYVTSRAPRPTQFDREWDGEMDVDVEFTSVTKVLMGREFGCISRMAYYSKKEGLKLMDYKVYDYDYSVSYIMITLDSARTVAEYMDSLYLDTVRMNGHLYEGVFEITMGPPDEGPANFFGRVMFARGVGAIRREIYPGEMWELLRYYIPEE